VRFVLFVMFCIDFGMFKLFRSSIFAVCWFYFVFLLCYLGGERDLVWFFGVSEWEVLVFVYFGVGVGVFLMSFCLVWDVVFLFWILCFY